MQPTLRTTTKYQDKKKIQTSDILGHQPNIAIASSFVGGEGGEGVGRGRGYQQSSTSTRRGVASTKYTTQTGRGRLGYLGSRGNQLSAHGTAASCLFRGRVDLGHLQKCSKPADKVGVYQRTATLPSLSDPLKYVYLLHLCNSHGPALLLKNYVGEIRHPSNPVISSWFEH
jgi:hypothetical protein